MFLKIKINHLCIGFLCAMAFNGCLEKKETNKPNAKDGAKTLGLSPQELVGEPDPMANPEAIPGGTLHAWGSSFPKSINMFLDYNSTSIEICGAMFESLLDLHSKENKIIGLLAESWEVSEDGLSFTFKLHPEAKWSDGKAISSEDVQFYYDVIMNPAHLTPLMRTSLEKFHRPEIIDSKTVLIKAKDKHWRNLLNAGQFYAFPKHIWENKDFNKINFEFPVVSGPYQLKDIKKNRYLEMERRADWWGWKKAYNQHKYNFGVIKYKFINEPTKALEAFKKGELDVFPVHSSTMWMKNTNFESVEKNWVVKQKVYNKEPMGFQGFAFNLRKEKFQDIKVRKALAHLLNREQINEKLMFNQYTLSNSYYPDLYEDYLNPNQPVIEYNTDLARSMLKESGWLVNDKGMLVKNGEVFSIIFMTAQEDLRHLNVYVQDLKAVGIVASIEKLSWSTIRKRIHKFDFDMYWMSWGSYRGRDPESGWSSKLANVEASNNVAGVADAVIDSLIEAQKTITDLAEREIMLKKVDNRLGEIMPYVLLWQAGYHRLMYWNKFGRAKNILGKFADPSESVFQYWYFDAEKEKLLQAAQSENKALPAEQDVVTYQE